MNNSKNWIQVLKSEVSRPWADPVWDVEKFLQLEKKFFFKNSFFFLFVLLYDRENFFDGKYKYFAAFDKEISAKKLVFRLL